MTEVEIMLTELSGSSLSSFLFVHKTVKIDDDDELSFVS